MPRQLVPLALLCLALGSGVTSGCGGTSTGHRGGSTATGAGDATHPPRSPARHRVAGAANPPRVRPGTPGDVAGAILLAVADNALRFAVTGIEGAIAIGRWLMSEGPGTVGEALLRALCEAERAPRPGEELALVSTDEAPPSAPILILDGSIGTSARPMRLEARRTDDDAVEIAVWAGGWLLCLSGEAGLLVDGRSIEELDDWPEAIEMSVEMHADDDIAATAPTEVLRHPFLLRATPEPRSDPERGATAANTAAADDGASSIPVTPERIRAALLEGSAPDLDAGSGSHPRLQGSVFRFRLPRSIARAVFSAARVELVLGSVRARFAPSASSAVTTFLRTLVDPAAPASSAEPGRPPRGS